MIRAFDFARVFLVTFFFVGFLLISSDGMQYISLQSVSVASLSSFILALLFACFDWLSKRFSLRAFNVFILGSLLGYLFSLTFISCLSQLSEWTPGLLIHSKWLSGIKFSLLLFGIYFGISLVARASDELYMSVPLVRFRFHNTKKKDLLVDKTALYDARLLDLAGCGMFDHRLVIGRHTVKEIQDDLSHHDETVRQRSRYALDLINSLEMLPRLNLRFYDTEFSEVHDPLQKMIRIARSIDADIIRSSRDPKALTQIEEIRFINLQALARSMQCPIIVGDCIEIKIRRAGQEKGQGVGFHEDGSMILVNQAGDKIGQTVCGLIQSINHSMHDRLIIADLVDMTALTRSKESIDISSKRLWQESENDQQ